MLYSCHLKKLEAFHIKCLQRILKMTWQDRVSHLETLKCTSSRSIEAISNHQLRWLGHLIRRSEERIPWKVLYGQLRLGHCSAGEPKKTFKDQLMISLKKCGFHAGTLETADTDRPNWRCLCHDGVKVE